MQQHTQPNLAGVQSINCWYEAHTVHRSVRLMSVSNSLLDSQGLLLLQIHVLYRKLPITPSMVMTRRMTHVIRPHSTTVSLQALTRQPLVMVRSQPILSRFSRLVLKQIRWIQKNPKATLTASCSSNRLQTLSTCPSGSHTTISKSPMRLGPNRQRA